MEGVCTVFYAVQGAQYECAEVEEAEVEEAEAGAGAGAEGDASFSSFSGAFDLPLPATLQSLRAFFPFHGEFLFRLRVKESELLRMQQQVQQQQVQQQQVQQQQQQEQEQPAVAMLPRTETEEEEEERVLEEDGDGEDKEVEEEREGTGARRLDGDAGEGHDEEGMERRRRMTMRRRRRKSKMVMVKGDYVWKDLLEEREQLDVGPDRRLVVKVLPLCFPENVHGVYDSEEESEAMEVMAQWVEARGRRDRREFGPLPSAAMPERPSKRSSNRGSGNSRGSKSRAVADRLRGLGGGGSGSSGARQARDAPAAYSDSEFGSPHSQRERTFSDSGDEYSGGGGLGDIARARRDSGLFFGYGTAGGGDADAEDWGARLQKGMTGVLSMAQEGLTNSQAAQNFRATSEKVGRTVGKHVTKLWGTIKQTAAAANIAGTALADEEYGGGGDYVDGDVNDDAEHDYEEDRKAFGRASSSSSSSSLSEPPSASSGIALSEVARVHLQSIATDYATVYSDGDLNHQRMLVSLWQHIFPGQPFGRRATKWKDFGCQKNDPILDMRGHDVLVIKCILHFAGTHSERFKAIVRAQRPRTSSHYPVMVVCTNLVVMLCELIGVSQILADGDPEPRAYWEVFETPNAFEHIFALACLHLDYLWKERNANRSMFGPIIASVRNKVEALLHLAPKSLQEMQVRASTINMHLS